MQFVNISYKHPNLEEPIEYGWCLKLSTLQEVLRFLIDKDWVSEKAVKKYIEHIEKQVKKGSQCCVEDNFIKKINQRAEIKRTTFIDELCKDNAKRAEVMLKFYPLYVQKVGSWIPISNNITEHESKESECFPGDEKEPRYLQWQSGKHWYVKVGDIDVIVNNCQKWNTKEEAEKAFNEWKKI